MAHPSPQDLAVADHATRPDAPIYDVVVIGGGAAGLSAALLLARARRKVAVVDSATPRNAPAAHMHGYLSRDGMPPSELIAAGRAEVAGYGGELIDGTVEALMPGFSVLFDGGKQLRARRLLVTTGLRDELPDVMGVSQRWGRDVLQCPYCHGWEVRDQPIGVLASQPASVDQALLVRQWSEDVIFFAHTYAPSESERERLSARGIQIVDGIVGEIVVRDDVLRGVELADGSSIVPRTALFVFPRFIARSEVLTSGLGCEVDDNGFIRVNEAGATSVFGVWAAGNVVNPRAQVIIAAGAGSAAAFALNHDLTDEDVSRAVEARRAERDGGFSDHIERRGADTPTRS
jgi:thioredoxin reductase